MITFNLDKEAGLVHVKVRGPLEKADFDQLAAEVDPFIAGGGKVAGLLIEAERFPGWEDFPSFLRHIRFVSEHHRKIGKVALVTDSPVGALGEHVAAHFVAAEIRHYHGGETDTARAWLLAREEKASA